MAGELGYSGRRWSVNTLTLDFGEPTTAPQHYSGLFNPPDLDAAYDAWKCTCGPGSVAALLGLTCEAVRPHFPGHEQRGYANPTHVQNALRSLGYRVTSDWVKPDHKPYQPAFGLVFVQFGGPWLAPGVPVGAAYRKTHWSAINGAMAYDVNAEGGWWRVSDWAEEVLPYIAKAIKRCDGTFYVRASFEVTP